MIAPSTISASIVGASGYAGGELLRLLLDHPLVEIEQVTSRSLAGKPLHRCHPHLRGRTDLRFSDPTTLRRVDVLFLCLPHGEAAGDIDRYLALADRVIDLSADFRLRGEAEYKRWYAREHPRAELLNEAEYGLAETNRCRLAGARLISGVGCNATAMNLALLPFARAGVIERAVVELKVGSSESGSAHTAGSHHPERSRAVRSFAPTGHRHQAEVHQELGEFELHVSVTAIELVRGVLCTAHVFPNRPLDTPAVWTLLREAYADEPFVRIVRERSGLHRYPDPKVLAGSNFADVGFEIDEQSGRIVVMCAIDNLMKGAAGSAVQAMNVAQGFEETAGLTFTGLHPV